MKYSIQLVDHESGQRSQVMTFNSLEELVSSLKEKPELHDNFIILLGVFDDDTDFKFSTVPLVLVSSLVNPPTIHIPDDQLTFGEAQEVDINALTDQLDIEDQINFGD